MDFHNSDKLIEDNVSELLGILIPKIFLTFLHFFDPFSDIFLFWKSHFLAFFILPEIEFADIFTHSRNYFLTFLFITIFEALQKTAVVPSKRLIKIKSYSLRDHG